MAEAGVTRPGSLDGKRIVVTRAIPQAEPLVSALKGAGAIPIGLPLLEIVDAADGGAALRQAVETLTADDWLVLLSPNGARRILEVPQPPALPNVAVIASGTGAVLDDAGWPVDLIPAVASSVGLLEAFKDKALVGRVLIAQAEVGRRELADGLAARGVEVETVVAYRNIMPNLDPLAVAASAEADAVVFASPSAVDRYVTNIGSTPKTAVCIGSVTATAAVEAGFDVTTSAKPTVEAIVSTLRELGSC